MKYILFGSILLSVLTVHAQVEPVLFEPGLISNGGVFGLTLSPDSKTALWVSSNGKRDTLKIMESRKIKGVWTLPVVASFSSSTGAWKDIDPMFSPDGKTVLFQSTRKDGRDSSRNDFDIWAVRRSGDGWSKPYSLGNKVNTTSSESYASIAKNGNIYFMKENEDGLGKSDIYVADLGSGKFERIKNLGSPVNTTERESNPYISPKEDYLIYFSTDKNGFGEVDLYITFRKNGKWTTPRNLGIPINSAAAEFCPFVHEREKRLYFSRQVKEGDSFKEDIYYVPFDVDRYR
jgi:WD40-like Beta Propeller Repeat